jgi:DNA ligase (NAD+)
LNDAPHETAESNGESAEVSSNATTASGATVVSFSNPRNAASGILLRKESDDPEEQSSSNELRSLLRFYAYDLSGLVELSGDETPNGSDRLQQQQQQQNELDGLQLRAQLADWNFPLALPVVVTNIEWKNHHQNVPSSDEDNTENETEVSWDEWFQETILAENQIRPIMDYFSALEIHRERLQEEDENLLLPTPGTEISHRTSDDSEECYDWGDFDVDGCVHKVTHASLRSVMGYSTKSPKWATAHKFPAQSSVARLLDIVVQVGRTGALTPVAILEPTEVGGVTVQRATLHNFGHLQEILGNGTSNNSSEVGDQPEAISSRIPKYEPVLVQRAGDVIPQVVRRIKSSSEPSSLAIDDDDCWISLDVPKRCPSCESPVAYDTIGPASSKSNTVGQVLRCCGPPLLCPPRAITSLKHAFSRDALDLTGLSEARIQQLKDAGLLQFPSDVFRMGDAQWEILRELPGWGEKSCQNLRDVCETVSSKGITLGRFVYSLGIRHLGKHTSELVASCYGSVGAFLEALETASSYTHKEPNADQSEEDANDSSLSHPFPPLEHKLGIGPVAVDSLLAFAKSKELTDATKALAESLAVLEQDIVADDSSESPSSEAAAAQLPWKGFRVVFTGSLGDGLTRSKAQEIAKQLGAKATPGSVSKNTDLVVFGDKGGKKLTQARGLGVATMEANAFVNLARDHGFLSDDDGDGDDDQ